MAPLTDGIATAATIAAPATCKNLLRLTGVLAEPAQRRQGVASGLLRHALTQSEGPVWLFCHPELATFYARLGFASSERLPAELAERLARYRRHKPLLAMESRGAY